MLPDRRDPRLWGCAAALLAAGGVAASVTPWSNAAIGASSWWSKVPNPPRTVTLAVLDAGIGHHDEVDGRVVARISSVKGAAAWDPFNPHGTSVAAIAAGAHDGDPVDGVAPTARLLSVRVTDDQARVSPADFAAGLEAAWSHPADVVLAALSFPAPPGEAPCDAMAAVMGKLAARGIVVVAAEPDHLLRPEYPAACGARFANLVVVGAADRWGRYASPTGAGAAATLAAPGDDVLTFEPGHKVPIAWRGTSAAAAVAAGALALALAAQEPGVTAVDLAHAVRKKGKPLGGSGVPALCLEAAFPAKLGSLAGACGWP